MTQVSVIIPSFNRAHVLRRAIDSVLAQQTDSVEILVVDDGSTDGTEADSRVRYLRNDNNLGVAESRNRALRAANGEFIAFLDSDDYWSPGKLNAQLACFRANPDAVFCGTNERWLHSGAEVALFDRQSYLEDLFAESLEYPISSPSAIMLRRDVIDLVGLFNKEFRVFEDYDYLLRIAAQGRGMILVPEVLTNRTLEGHDRLLHNLERDELARREVASIRHLMDSGVLTSKQHKQAHARVDRLVARMETRHG